MAAADPMPIVQLENLAGNFIWCLTDKPSTLNPPVFGHDISPCEPKVNAEHNEAIC